MQVASRFSVPVAIVPWPELRARITCVVKLSYDLQTDGSVVLAARPDPITPDTATPDGVLLFPSDFVRSKSRCDVLLVGRAITLPAARTSLSLLRMTKVVDHAAALGPMAISSLQVAEVQYAPSDQRVPHVRLPFRFRYEREGLVLDAMIPGPMPQVGYVRQGNIELQHPVVDTIALDPERRRVTVSLRAQVDGVDLQAGLLMVDDLARLEPRSAEAFAWKRVEVVLAPPSLEAPAPSRAPPIDDEEPTTAEDREPTSFEADESTITISERRTGSQPAAPGETVTLSEPGTLGERRPSRTVTSPFARAKSTTLPFRRVAQPAPPEPPSLAQTADLGRSTQLGSNLPASSPWPFAGEQRPLSSRRPIPAGTPPATPFDRPVSVPPPISAPPPASIHASAHATPASTAAPPPPRSMVGFDLAPLSAARSLTPVQAEPLEAARLRSPELSLDQFTAIKAELWTSAEPRRAVLQRHGLSELRWRMIERAFALPANRGETRAVLEMLSGLRRGAAAGYAAPHAADAHAPTDLREVENADTSDIEAVR